MIVGVLALLLGGIAHLTQAYGIAAMDQNQEGYQSVLSQLTGAVMGHGWFYYLTIGSVLAVLALSANTSFVDFPRLCRLIAQDDYLPRSFAVPGRRLVFSFGILSLAAAAALLLVVFEGITDRLIPLFAVGAFTAFTLSQAGMVVHWQRYLAGTIGPKCNDGSPLPRVSPTGARLRLAVNGLGAAATGAALIVIMTAKFKEGAWITILAIPGLILLFRLVHRHYRRMDTELEIRTPINLNHFLQPVVMLPIGNWNRAAKKSLRFSMWLSADVVAIHLCNIGGDDDGHEAERIRREWAENVEEPVRGLGRPLPRLVVRESRYRTFVEPLLNELDKLKAEFRGRPIAVVLPEVVSQHWWQVILHMHRARRLRWALRERGDRNVVVVSVPWYLHD